MIIHLQLSAETSGEQEPLPMSNTAMQLSRLRRLLQEELSEENAGRRGEQGVPATQEPVHGLGSMGQSANTSASAAASSTESHGTSVARGTSEGPSAGSTWSSSSSTTSATLSHSSTFSGPFMTAEGAGAPPFPFTFASGGPFPPGMQSMGPAPAGGAQAARFVFGAGPPGGPSVIPWQQVGC